MKNPDLESRKAAMRAASKRWHSTPEIDRAVCAQLSQLPEIHTGVCMAYLSLPDEIGLDGWIADALKSGIRVAVPAVNWSEGTMEAVELESLDRVVSGRHGTREPEVGAAVMPIEELEVIFVPGLAFDLAGGRLGRGGGFYDRFLARVPESSTRIGVGPQARVVDTVPRGKWDAMLDMLVTEAGVFRFDRLKN